VSSKIWPCVPIGVISENFKNQNIIWIISLLMDIQMGTSMLGESPCKGFPTVTRAIVSEDGKWVFEEIKLETLPRGGAGERSGSPYQPAAQNKQLSSVASPPAVYNFASAICRDDRCEPPDFVRPALSRQKCATTAARISTGSTTTPPHAAHDCVRLSCIGSRTVGQKHFIKWSVENDSSTIINIRLQ